MRIKAASAPALHEYNITTKKFMQEKLKNIFKIFDFFVHFFELFIVKFQIFAKTLRLSL